MLWGKHVRSSTTVYAMDLWLSAPLFAALEHHGLEQGSFREASTMAKYNALLPRNTTGNKLRCTKYPKLEHVQNQAANTIIGQPQRPRGPNALGLERLKSL